MKQTKHQIKGLSKNYNTTTDAEIRTALQQTKLVIEKKGKYFELGPVKLREVQLAPRNISYPFSPGELGPEVKGLKEMCTIPFLVKSSSRFLLKPDIGEVLDQLELSEMHLLKAIYIVANSEECTNVGEFDEFVMEARLLH